MGMVYFVKPKYRSPRTELYNAGDVTEAVILTSSALFSLAWYVDLELYRCWPNYDVGIYRVYDYLHSGLNARESTPCILQIIYIYIYFESLEMQVTGN